MYSVKNSEAAHTNTKIIIIKLLNDRKILAAGHFLLLTNNTLKIKIANHSGSRKNILVELPATAAGSK